MSATTPGAAASLPGPDTEASPTRKVGTLLLMPSVIVLLAWMIVAFGLGKIAAVGVLFVALLLIYEHSLVKHDDLSRVNAAFFTMKITLKTTKSVNL